MKNKVTFLIGDLEKEVELTSKEEFNKDIKNTIIEDLNLKELIKGFTSLMHKNVPIEKDDALEEWEKIKILMGHIGEIVGEDTIINDLNNIKYKVIKKDSTDRDYFNLPFHGYYLLTTDK